MRISRFFASGRDLETLLRLGNASSYSVEGGPAGIDSVECELPGSYSVEGGPVGSHFVESERPGSYLVESGRPGSYFVESGCPGSHFVESGCPGSAGFQPASRAANTDSLVGRKLDLYGPDLIRQLRSVLRLGADDKFILLDGKGGIFDLSIEIMEKSKLSCRIDSLHRVPSTTCPVVSVGMALIKADRFEWSIEKLTELGAGEIVPVVTRHCVTRISHDAKGDERITSKVTRWQAIAREAAEQCERPTIPPVVKPVELVEFLTRPTCGAPNYDLKFICAERLDAAPLVKALLRQISDRDPSSISRINTVSLLIGPEGGFTSDELGAAQEHGYLPVTLGPRILRSETAAMVAMSQVASLLDI